MKPNSRASENPLQPHLRPPAVAGSFYPADPRALTALMDGMLSDVPEYPAQEEILALIVPHAGYIFSGPVAAHAYGALRGAAISRVVVIAPSHYEMLNFTSAYEGDGYTTPLGCVPVDREFTRRLTEFSASIRLSELGHHIGVQGAEHAIEVQLPWLQHVLGNFSLVPLIMGDQSYENSRELGLALARLIRKESSDGDGQFAKSPQRTLIVASSDLSHYHASSVAESMDRKTLSAIEAWDYLSMAHNFDSRIWEACGGAPIVAAMIAAEHLGAGEAQILQYSHSGAASAESSHVVGYGAVALVKHPGETAQPSPFSLDAADKEQLLQIARRSVETVVRRYVRFDPPSPASLALHQDRAAFVTLREGEFLRGCMGCSSAIEPLYLTVRDTAALAAVCDPRFHPISEPELSRLHIEVSVLSPLRHVTDPRQIRIGQHGLLLRNGRREGLLLPQVTEEQAWDRIRFLQETSFKAGLSPDCWQDESTDIFRFTAEIFAEPQPPGARLPNLSFDA